MDLVDCRPEGHRLRQKLPRRGFLQILRDPGPVLFKPDVLLRFGQTGLQVDQARHNKSPIQVDLLHICRHRILWNNLLDFFAVQKKGAVPREHSRGPIQDPPVYICCLLHFPVLRLAESRKLFYFIVTSNTLIHNENSRDIFVNFLCCPEKERKKEPPQSKMSVAAYLLLLGGDQTREAS